MISVIVCTYNQQDTIARTLDSILMQQCHEPIEIIVGEDCSQDGTLEVCRQYAERHPSTIRLMANNPNKGILDNYFDCIMAARGEYIADCAGDDYWTDPLKLEKELLVMERHPDVGLVHTNWCTSLDPLPSPTPINLDEMVITDGDVLLEEILTQTSRPVVHLCTALFRAQWIQQAHDEFRQFFRNEEYPCEDVQVAFFLSRMGRVAFLPDVTLCYTISETTSNSKSEAKMFHFFRRAGQLDYDLATTFHLMTPRVKRFLQTRIYSLMMHAFRLHDGVLFAEAQSTRKKWHLPHSTLTLLLTIICNIPPLWSLGLWTRKNLKSHASS